MSDTKETVQEALIRIQKSLEAPKNQWNKFGEFHYRSCEDILSAVKPLLQNCTLVMSDEIVEIGGRVYVKATATLKNGESISATAYAREPEHKTKMDDAQVTGSSSSYARKYALNGLFCIDDTKDADTQDNTEEGKKPPAQAVKATKPTVTSDEGLPWLTPGQHTAMLARINAGEWEYVQERMKEYRMKKIFRETLETAIKNYQQRQPAMDENVDPDDIPF